MDQFQASKVSTGGDMVHDALDWFLGDEVVDLEIPSVL